MNAHRLDVLVGGLVLALLAAASLAFGSRFALNLLTLCLIYAIWAASWDFMSGLSGRENFGHAMFIGAGAYTAALLSTRTTMPIALDVPVGALAAVALSLMIGLPTLRLRGPYFGLATLAGAAALERLTVVLGPATGGEEGIVNIPRLLDSRLGLYYLTLALFAATLATLLSLARSRWGLVLRAIRGDEAACQAAGIDVVRYKVGSLMVSAAFAGAGGALYAHQQLYVNPHIFSVAVSITVVLMAYVGGLGSIYGAALAAMALTAAAELLRGFGAFRLLVYTALLLLVIVLRPGGVIAPLWRGIRGRAA